MTEERYKVGDKITLTYIGFEKPQIIETEIKGISSRMPNTIRLPLGAQGYVAYYNFKRDFAENLRIENDELILTR